MRMKFYHCLIVVILPYLVTATVTETLCTIGTSTGMAIGCSVAPGVTGLIATAAAPFTYGVSTIAGFAASAAISGGCAIGKAVLPKGKEYYRFYHYLVKLNYFD